MGPNRPPTGWRRPIFQTLSSASLLSAHAETAPVQFLPDVELGRDGRVVRRPVWLNGGQWHIEDLNARGGNVRSLVEGKVNAPGERMRRVDIEGRVVSPGQTGGRFPGMERRLGVFEACFVEHIESR
jgi:hypothetical protein